MASKASFPVIALSPQRHALLQIHSAQSALLFPCIQVLSLPASMRRARARSMHDPSNYLPTTLPHTLPIPLLFSRCTAVVSKIFTIFIFPFDCLGLWKAKLSAVKSRAPI